MSVKIDAWPWYAGDAVKPKPGRGREIRFENPEDIVDVLQVLVVLPNKKLHHYLELRYQPD